MRPELISSQLAVEPWQAERMAVCDKRSLHAMRIIELAHTLAAAETAVLMGDDANAVSNLKQLQASTSQMLADLERAFAQAG